MRIYSKPFEAVREVERDLFEMGVDVWPSTMQDKFVGDNPDYKTKELQEYAFQIRGWDFDAPEEALTVNYILTGQLDAGPHPQFGGVMKYIQQEFLDRTADVATNPGKSWECRKQVWKQFLHDGKFAYTYSERLIPQWPKFFEELTKRPATRQAILTLHTNICPTRHTGFLSKEIVNPVYHSMDSMNTGGSGRIPCSMYYQAILRGNELHWIYTMRSCDFLVHFPVDIFLAMRLQKWAADKLGVRTGPFTYFTGSLHAYFKDLKERGIF